MTDNLTLWNKLKRVPEQHLKGFKRQGGFSGTAIKPMWAFQRMTEEFGACGTGWGVHSPEFNVQQAGNEILVYCTARVWYGDYEKVLTGVGGDKILSVGSNGPRTDDEAFKKAFTDAVTNALKFIGTGADVHMGLFDGSKYIDEKPKAKMDLAMQEPDERGPDDPFPQINGTAGKPKYKGSKNADTPANYMFLEAAIRAQRTVDDLMEWGNNPTNQNAINSLPAEWVPNIRNEFKDRLSALKEAA